MEKWMLKDTKATDRDRSIIAGHYIFSKPEFKNKIKSSKSFN